jgi:hypothetical protein
MKRIRKIMVMAQFKMFSLILNKGREKINKATFKIVGFPEEIRTGCPPNRILQLDPTSWTAH